MNKSLNKIVSLGLLILTFSCSQETVVNNSSVIQPVQIFSSNSSDLNFKLIKNDEIPTDIFKITYAQMKDLSDKESKRRGIDLFNLPKNPIGLEITSGTNKLGYILNYIGTSQNTEDVNIEARALYSPQSSAYSLNYSGPITNSNVKLAKKDNKSPLLKSINKDEGLTFELIQGLPSEEIVNTFSNYIDDLTNNLKKNYNPQTINISSDDVFIYAIHFNGAVTGFFFESHANKVILGDRKYADLQVGVFVSSDNKIKGNYSLVEFNPKTKVNSDPVYKSISKGSVNMIQLGEL